jgi:inner membrane transporter RhtA
VNRIPPQLLAVAAIFSVQFGSAFARTFFGETGPLGAAGLRLVLAAVLMAVIVRPRVLRWNRAVWMRVIGLGVALAGMNSVIYLAIQQVPIGVAVTVEFLGPLTVALVQTRRVVDAAWALLGLVGVVLLGLDGFTGSLSLVGLGLAALAAVFWAGYILMSSSLASRAHDSSATGLQPLAASMVVAAIVVLPFGAPPAVAAVGAHPWLAAVFVIVAVLTSVLPYSLEFVALRRMPSRVFGVFSSLGPAVAALAGLLVLGQALTVLQIGALVLVVAASVGVTVFARTPNLDVL